MQTRRHEGRRDQRIVDVRGRSAGRFAGLLIAALACVGLWCACGSDARLAGKKLRAPTVRTVSYYGVTLDQSASPQQVAFVALQAIREDVAAKSSADREAALDKEFDLAAVNAIAAKNKTSLPQDQFLHKVVYHWAPTVAHYVNDFPTQWDAAAGRLVREDAKPGKSAEKADSECQVALRVSDPSGDPNAGAVVQIWMALDAGYWRVTHLGFDATRRGLIKTPSASAGPTSASGD